jgi:kexin
MQLGLLTKLTPMLLATLLLSLGNVLIDIPLIQAGQTRKVDVPYQDHERNHYYAMHLSEGVDPEDVAAELLLTLEGSIGELERHFLFSIPRTDGTGSPVDTSHLDDSSSSDPILHKRSALGHGILYMEYQRAKKLHKRSIILRDPQETSPLISEAARDLEISDPLFPVQWHLLNSIQLGHDVNVTGVWRQGHFGENVTVAIVDDGLDMDSLDLKDNYFAEGSYDFNDHNLVPKPKLSDDQHGTRCAGEIAAVRNDVCGVGVAYKTRVAGLRILSADISDADEAIALNYAWQDNHIYSCSWGPPDDGRSMDAPGLLIKRAFVNGINKGRGGLGSIYVFASGNGGAQEDNCNFDGYTNSIYSITVGAVDRMGQHPYYSELCSAQLVVTYSSGSGDYIHTTDVGLQKCTDRHGGTSAAAPLAAGILALALGVRPDLTWRDLQHLCVQTAQIVDESDPDWDIVADGRKFNHKYGFGKLDAYRLVEEAKTFEHVKPQAWYHSEQIIVEQDIPDNDAEGLTSMFGIFPDDLQRSNFEKVEHVQILMNLTHQRRGDIAIDLTSPAGIVSHIATKRKFDTSTDGMIGWYFMSVKHWYFPPKAKTHIYL